MKVTIPAAAEFAKSPSTVGATLTESLNHFTTATDFALAAATYAGTDGVASDSTLSTGGVVGFKVAKANWGGSCCLGGGCEDNNSLKKCNLASGTLGLFMSNTDRQIAHAATDMKATADAQASSTSI